MTGVYRNILRKSKQGKKLFAVLVDPEKFNEKVIFEAERNSVDFIFVGGSTVSKSDFDKAVSFIRKNCRRPIVIFPGDEKQVSKKADALLLLSLISGRNAEYLIGKHVKAALPLRKSGIEIISTGYIIIDNGISVSSAARVSGTNGIKQDEKNLIRSTALAGELMGNKIIYLEGGSGSAEEVPSSLIKSVRKDLSVPLIVGGGIDNAKKAARAWNAGADVVVVGNAIEKNITLISEIAVILKSGKRA